VNISTQIISTDNTGNVGEKKKRQMAVKNRTKYRTMKQRQTRQVTIRRRRDRYC